MELTGLDKNFEIFKQKYEEEISKITPVNIMIIGKTGVGKSTLINHVFRERLVDTGIGKPVTKHLNKITKEGVPINLYDTKGLELNDQVQREIKEEILGEIKSMASSGNPKDYVHVIWYCINANSNRLEDFEIEWINEFSKQIPVVLVMTQCFNPSFNEMKSFIDNLNLPVVNTVPILAQEVIFSKDMIIQSFGLNNLIEVTSNSIDSAERKAFINAQKVNIKKKEEQCKKEMVPIIMSAFGTGFTPIPFADAVALVPLQLGMVARLTANFGINLDKSFFTAVISAAIGSGGATVIGRSIVASVMKFLPGVGSIAGGTINGTTAAVLTAAMGYAYIELMKLLSVKLYNGEQVDKSEVVRLMKELYSNQLLKGEDLIKDIELGKSKHYHDERLIG